jgi:hypothetical protein
MVPVTVNIYYANTSLEGVLEESTRDFPLPGIGIKLEREHSAEMQADSTHEIVRIVLDPGHLASLLGIGKVEYGSVDQVGGKPGELTKRFSFDILSVCLDIFQIIIRPIIRSLSEIAKVTAVIIQARLGFDSAASWTFSITTIENLYSFPEIPLKNVIDPDTARKTVSDWTKRSNEIKKIPMKAVRASRKIIAFFQSGVHRGFCRPSFQEQSWYWQIYNTQTKIVWINTSSETGLERCAWKPALRALSRSWDRLKAVRAKAGVSFPLSAGRFRTA